MRKNAWGRVGFGIPSKSLFVFYGRQWEKRDKVDDEIYLVDPEVVKNDLEDVADQPQNESQDDRN